MRVTFLGTAASEGYPDAFCDCDNCRRARELGGPSLRKQAAAPIDDELLIDLGPDLMAAALMHGLSFARLRYCLQTHEHHDHLDPSHLSSRSEACGVHGNPRLHLYASEGALRRAAEGLSRRLPEDGLLDPAGADRLNLTACPIEPFQTFAVGPYAVTSLPAVHDPDHITALLYIVERDGRSIVIYLAGLAAIPNELYEAGRIDGAGGWALLRHVTWPLLTPSTFFLLIVSTVNAFQAFSPIYTLTRVTGMGGGEAGGPLDTTLTITVSIFRNFYERANSVGYAATVSFLLFFIILGLTRRQFREIGRRVHYQ